MPTKKYKRLKDDSVIKCNFENGEYCSHTTEDSQYNILIDLIINFSEIFLRT